MLGLQYMEQFTGDAKAHCVNTIDSVLIPKFQGVTIAPSQLEAGDAHEHYLVYGDSGGNLVLIKDGQPVFYDQFSPHQVAAIQWLRISL